MSGNFLQIAQEQNGLSPSFGWGLILYSEKKEITAAMLTAAAINAEIAADTCIGIIHGWNTVAGASIAEKSLERANQEVNVNKPELLADTLTFDDNLVNQDVLKRLSGKTFNAVFLDDMGYAFGEESLVPSSISTMKVNFSGKVTNGFQNDQSNEKTIAITARYLLGNKKVGFIDAGTEVEDIDPKIPLIGKISSITTHTSSSIVFVMDLLNGSTGALLTTFVTTALEVNPVVNGITVTASGAFASNQLTLTLTKTVADFNTATDKIKLTLSTEAYYLTEISFNIADFLA